MKKERRWLVNAIRGDLLPEFAHRGFEVLPLPRAKLGVSDREFITAFPFGRLRRTGKRGLDQVEIQLAPRGRAAFRLNIGVIPPDGVSNVIQHKEEHWPAEELMVGWWLEETFSLYSCPVFLSWFAVRRIFGAETVEDDYKKLIMRVVRLLPEIEAALDGGRQGPHLRRVRVKLPVKMG